MSSFSDVLGLVAAIAAVLAVTAQTANLRRATQGSLLLELRRLFEDCSETADKFREDAAWHHSQDTDKHEDCVALDKYLGLLEFCEVTVANKTIDQDAFMAHFGYRVELIMDHPAIEHRLSKACSVDWSLLGALISRVRNHPKSKPSGWLENLLGVKF